MPAPQNQFKQRLHAGERQIGLWLGLADPYAAELIAGAGFDWLVIDGEHAPNDLRSTLAQLQALSTHTVSAVCRPPVGESWMIKQLLDIGCQTILVPMVETAEQAKDLVRAVKYPPHGIRGVGAGLARASRFNAIPDYLVTADEQTCLLVQLETLAGLDQLEAIAAVDGVDGIFIGPADLAADMGYLGRPGHAEVQARVEDAITRIVATGKAAGILTSDQQLARRYLELGARFVAVGSDIGLIGTAARQLAAAYR
ncbi:4-hydroxy-2-oxoheptanedioate aldolase [Aestuariivirga sp. YIM B02566]|uniref:4-hydroxy-2-oxoheptanedioate aldolase n=1 Tax=Taklimakanibacter albus TaxID=2800327 RepID=A0ACC5RDH3_9HYPH|nr:4-hydroxy-2-oxoheptanedioate aldolase [Aestuariivirga sp. YIM B02566]MBK1870684.1 4-hydroxy-2-oxoheptanedioate aldolase [Aestuariivirga sp. YIM B02566]